VAKRAKNGHPIRQMIGRGWFAALDSDLGAGPMMASGSSMSAIYKVHEFAELSGVTVKTLHHYDRLGLLKPRRAETGYRIYTECDLERLQQIVALKYLGLSLQQIRVVLDQAPLELPDALRLQRRVLEEKQRHLARALSTIVEAENSIRPGEAADPAILKRLIETINMQDKADWLKKYWSDEQLIKYELAWSKLKRGPVEEWKNLMREIRAAAATGEDPASEKAQVLGEHYVELMEKSAESLRDMVHLIRDPEFQAGHKRAVADKEKWLDDIRARLEQSGIRQTISFIRRVIAARPKGAPTLNVKLDCAIGDVGCKLE
jgi:DNA-binding transcriptional MerR regulator